MAHFNHIKPGGVWSFFALLSSGIMSIIDKTLAKAINGDDGGTWTPQNPSVGGPACPIILGGDGLEVPGPFLATDANITITAGKFLTLNSLATFNALIGSTSNLRGVVNLKNNLNVGLGAGGNIGKIVLNASTYLQVLNSASILVEDGGSIDLKPGAIGYVEPLASIELTGDPDPTSVPNLAFGNYGRAVFGNNSYCWIGALGEFRIKAIGAGFVDANATFRVDGSLRLTNIFTLDNTTVGTWRGIHTLKSGMTITSEIGSNLTFAGVDFTGPITRSGTSGYDVWRTQNLPAPASAGTTVTISGQSKDRFVLNMSTNNGVDYDLLTVGVPDDIRVMFVMPKNTWAAGVRILANGGQLMAAIRTNVQAPMSVVLYKSGGVWSVESWSGVWIAPLNPSNKIDFV